MLTKEEMTEALMNAQKYDRIVSEIKQAISDGRLHGDDAYLYVYRQAGKISPEGWYKEAINDVAYDLTHNEENYKEFRKYILNDEEGDTQ